MFELIGRYNDNLGVFMKWYEIRVEFIEVEFLSIYFEVVIYFENLKKLVVFNE